ncbi:MAG: hypothetical protein ABW168_28975 [Sedimenticola sp.]
MLVQIRLVLAAIFDLRSEILRKLPETEVKTDLRMIDVVRWATAAEGVMDVEPGVVLAACERNYALATTISLDDDLVGSVLLEYMSSREEWHGTSSELLDRLNRKAGRWVARSKEWPKQPNQLAKAINRLITSLRKEGIDIESQRQGGTGNRLLAITNRNCGPGGESAQQEENAA